MTGRLYNRLAWACALLTWPLISFGALVRLKGAGLACPDWPLCYGKILPPPGFGIAMEVGHRAVASLLGLMVIALVVVAHKTPEGRPYIALSWAALVLVVAQGVLGGLTVLMMLTPAIVTSHLIGGNLTLALLVSLALASGWNSRPEAQPKAGRASAPNSNPLLGRSIAVFAVLFVILASGGANSSTYSGFACDAFPGCHSGSPLSFSLEGETVAGVSFAELPKELEGHFLPLFQNEWVHMTHRAVAILGGSFLIYAALVWFRRSDKPAHRKAGAWIVALVALEWCVGVANAVLWVPVPVSAAHTAVAATLVWAASAALARSYYDERVLSTARPRQTPQTLSDQPAR